MSAFGHKRTFTDACISAPALENELITDGIEQKTLSCLGRGREAAQGSARSSSNANTPGLTGR